VAVAYSKVLSSYLPGGIEKNHKNLSQDSPSPGRGMNPGPPEYEAGMLNTRPQRSVTILT
jgi:hypothetical protein